jgi:hypothetical protein
MKEGVKERDHSEDVGVDGREILNRISGKLCEGVDWIHLVQDRGQWRAVVNTVMKILVANRREIA